MTRVLVLGRRGQLARALADVRWPDGWTPTFAGRDTLDLLRPETIAPFLDAEAPDVVINTAAYTAVDAAEADPQGAFALNSEAPTALAEACRVGGRLLLHLSTDYVFAGDGGAPYGEEAATGPLNVYGRSKAAGEERVMASDPDAVVARTSWLLSPGSGFVRAILSRLALGETVRVIEDQRGNPTHADDLAQALVALTAARLSGIGSGGLLHMAGPQDASWFDLASAMGEATGRKSHVQPVKSAEYATQAVRPFDSRISVIRLKSVYGIALTPWTAWITETAQLGHIRAQKGVETRQQSGV